MLLSHFTCDPLSFVLRMPFSAWKVILSTTTICRPTRLLTARRYALATAQSQGADNGHAANIFPAGALNQQDRAKMMDTTHHRRAMLPSATASATFLPSPSPPLQRRSPVASARRPPPSPRLPSQIPPSHHSPTPSSRPSPPPSLYPDPPPAPSPPSSLPPSLPPTAVATRSSTYELPVSEGLKVCGTVLITGPAAAVSNPFTNFASCDDMATKMVRELEDLASNAGAPLVMPFALDSCNMSYTSTKPRLLQYSVTVCGVLLSAQDGEKLQPHLQEVMSLWRYHALLRPLPLPATPLVRFCPPLGYSLQTWVVSGSEGLPMAFLDISCSFRLFRDGRR